MKTNKKRYFIFGDVHGEYTALLLSLEKAGYSHEDPNHILVSLGDNFDRGKENVKLFYFLLATKDKGKLLHIQGNHDDMLKNYLIGASNGVWDAYYNGLQETLEDFAQNSWNNMMFDNDASRMSIRDKHPRLLEFLNSGVESIDIGQYHLTHAGYSKTGDEWDIFNFSHSEYFVENFPQSKIYDPNKIYVFGHWHAYRLIRKFKNKNAPIGLKLFRYKNFIGVDIMTNYSMTVGVLVLEQEGKKINEIKVQFF